MTTMATMTINMYVVKELVDEMVRRGVERIIPTQAIGAFKNKDIQEIIIDEEGTVFVQMVEDLNDPIMLPMFIEVA